MANIVYKPKTFPSTSYSSVTGKKYDKVSTCPYCGISTDATQLSLTAVSITNGTIVNATYKCTSCDRTFHVSYIKYNTEDKYTPFCIYPNFQGREFSEKINNVSPRFVKLFNQAFKAEYDNNKELACCGYRNSLEVLIKDYAINVLGEPKEEVSKIKLNNAITKYLSTVDMTNCADVIRILGNDNTHYERHYEEIDFDVFKQYLDIFIDMIDVQIKIKQPPVSRNN